MARQIRITADTSQLKKSVMDISKIVNKDLGRSKIELFTPDTKKFLRSEAVAAAANLKKKIDGIKQSTMDHQKAMAQVVKGSREELQLKLKILKASQQIVDSEKEHQELVTTSQELQRSNFSRGMMRTPGMQQMQDKMGQFSGLGMGGALGGMASAAGLAGILYGGKQVFDSREVFKQGADDRLKLLGRGATDLKPTNEKAMTEAGLNSLTLRQQRLAAMDVFGSKGASQEATIKRASFERNFGLEQGTMTGIGANFRPAMGGKQAELTTMKLQAALIASGIKDAVGPYLETAASMLTELNEKGFTMDENVLGLFNSMLKTGMGEGRVKQLAMGADQGIRGATGEANAFFQSAFNKAGIGGGTIGGAQAAMRMGGLFGADLDKYKGMGATDLKTFQTLGIGGKNHMKAVAGATLGQLDKLFGSDQDINKQLRSSNKQTREGGAAKRLSRLRYMMGAFGLKDEGQAAQVEGLLKTAQTASPAEQKKIMKKVQDIKESTPELENLKRINQSTAGVYDVLKNKKLSTQDETGEDLSDAFNIANSLLTDIDKGIETIAKGINSLLHFFHAGETPEEEIKRQEKSAKDIAGQLGAGNLPHSAAAMHDELKDVTQNLTYEDQISLGKKLKQKMEAESAKPKFLQDTRYSEMYNSPEFKYVRRGIEGEDRRKQREANQRTSAAGPVAPTVAPKNQPQYSAHGQAGDKETHKLLHTAIKHLKTTADHSKEKGTLKPASSSTSGN